MGVVVIGLSVFLAVYQPGRRYGPLEEVRTWKIPPENRSEKPILFKFYFLSKPVSEDELKRLAFERADALLEKYRYVIVSILNNRAWAKHISSAKEEDAVLLSGAIGIFITGDESGGCVLTALSPKDSLTFTRMITSMRQEYKYETFHHPSKDAILFWLYKESAK